MKRRKALSRIAVACLAPLVALLPKPQTPTVSAGEAHKLIMRGEGWPTPPSYEWRPSRKAVEEFQADLKRYLESVAKMHADAMSTPQASADLEPNPA